jgi:hypothetical protein
MFALKDVAKLIHKNKEEQNPILDLSKNNVSELSLLVWLLLIVHF